MRRYRPSETVDACIVGAGIGGIMAKILAEGGLSVVVIEAGPHWNPIRDFINDPYIMEKKLTWEMPTISTMSGRRGGRTAYGVGGRMNWWGAVNVRFRPSTFLAKSMQGFGDDWPVTYEELVPYYQKAERDLGVSGDHTTYPVPRDPFPLPAHRIAYADQVLKKGFDAMGVKTFPLPRGIVSQPYRGRPACNYCGFTLWGCPINAKANPVVTHVPQAMAAGAEIRANCYAREVTVDTRGRANGVIYFDLEGREQQQKARMVLLSCSSPLTARLLLNSKSKPFPNGLANNNGQVGRNVMSGGGGAVVWGIYEQQLNGYRGFGTLTSHDFFDSDPERGFVGGYMIITKNPGDRKLEELIGNVNPGWGTELKGFLKNFFPHCFGLQTVGTGLVNDKNRVEVAPDEKDRWGVPLARVTVYPDENARAMREHAIGILTEIHRAAGAVKTFVERGVGGPIGERPLAEDHREEPEPTIGRSGECRMGKDPKTSVVNPFCQSHEVKNLFLLDGSIAVTGAPVEETLTLIALTYRSGEYILQNRRDIFRA